MPRTTPTKVKSVLLSDYGPDRDGNEPGLDRFITTANLITTRLNTMASDDGYALASDELTEIETWLAAHAYVCSDQQKASETVDRASATFTGKTGEGLRGSKYGQMALDLDWTGWLDAITSRNVGTLTWGGTTEAEQRTYDERNS